MCKCKYCKKLQVESKFDVREVGISECGYESIAIGVKYGKFYIVGKGEDYAYVSIKYCPFCGSKLELKK